jgi:hypothetical protein
LALAVVDLAVFIVVVQEAAVAVLVDLLELLTISVVVRMVAVEFLLAADMAQFELSGLDAFVHSQITIRVICKLFNTEATYGSIIY